MIVPKFQELYGMNYYYITGTSRGIGKALAEELLQDGNNHVTGISRGHAIQHANYKHVVLDLSDATAVQSFHFSEHAGSDRIVLINNAGAMTDVKQIGNIDPVVIARDYHINLIAPAILMNNFIAAYKDTGAEKIIVNVSSGAGKRPIDGWAVYCATKAGLDMLTRVVADEQERNGNGFRVLSVAPGIVDTQMQTDIRSSDKKDFSRIEEFIDYKESGKLADPIAVARKYLRIINGESAADGVVFSVNDI